MSPLRASLCVLALLVGPGCFAEPVAEVTVNEADDDEDISTSDDGVQTTSIPGLTASATHGGSGGESSTGGPDDDESASTTGDEPGSTGEDAESSSSGEGSSSSGPALDCAGVPDGGATLDECGVCDGPGGPCWGCTVPAASNYDPLATVNDGTCNCEAAGGGISDQSNLSSDAGSGGADQWQSFTVGLSGGLTRIDLGVGSPISGDSSGTLRFYAGEGLAGVELGSQEVTFADVFNTMQEFELDTPIPMTAGELYTVRFTVPDVTVGWVDLDGGNPYPDGRASYGGDIDFVFRTHMAQCMPQ